MTSTASRPLAALLIAALALPCGGQQPGLPPAQTESDAYTLYELLAPGSAKFRIVYEVTATTAGARLYFNPIRKGSVATDESVLDRMTGKPLRFEVVSGVEARAGGVRGADTTGEYIKVHLARAVPPEGEARVLIDKTYEDSASYFVQGEQIVFSRSLGIRKNAVALPAGYELVSVNYPSQVFTRADGRVVVSFMNVGTAAVPYLVRAQRAPGRAAPSPSSEPRLAERARQDREIVYFLQPPETHAFDLYHDYTESRPGVDKYLNVVRAGSAVSRPSARILDTGESLRTETLQGDAITRAKIDIGQAVEPSTVVVVIRFAPVKAGESVRLRISETYTDSARYGLRDGELVWDRAFGRPANAVVLPTGWSLTGSSVPATVSEMPDGRVRLDFLNPRNDEIGVLITARRK